MEEILKSILKTEAEAEALSAQAQIEVKKVMEKAERDAAAVTREFSDKTARRAKEIMDAARVSGEAVRSAVMKQAAEQAQGIEIRAASRYGNAAQVCVDLIIGK
jgi:vacuolar-type H+-ATPase subunit H